MLVWRWHTNRGRIMKLNNIFLALASTWLFLAYGCLGGGGDTPDPSGSGGVLNVSVSPTSLSVKAGEKAEVVVDAKCSSKDLFASSCVINSAVIDYEPSKSDDLKSKVEIPLNYILKIGESKTFDIEVFSESLMALQPFSYLNENNPSTSTGGWTQYSQVLATTSSKFVGFGDEVCVQGLTVSPASQEVARGSTASYAIYGGKPPYRITSSIHALPPSPTTVSASGGTFTVAVPTSTLHTGATYTITDDAGKTASATLTITAPLTLSIQPTTVTVSKTNGGVVKFDVSGGIAPYRIYSNDLNYPPNVNTLASAGSFEVTVPAGAAKTIVTYTVIDTALTEKTATLVIDDKSSSSLKNAQVCTPVNNFSFNISNYTKGTMKIVAGEQTLQETVFGVLSGSGSGTITENDRGYRVSFSFANPPAKGVAIIAYYLTKVEELKEAVRDESLKISYGAITLIQAGSYLMDGSGKLYGQVIDNTITITAPLGMRDSQMIASYRGSPFVSKGGELVGKGDGNSKSFTLKTQYSPILEGSLKVFTDNQPATIETVNPLTGEFSVTFKTPPALNEEIRASYVLSKVNTKINLNIDSLKFPIQMEVKK